MGKIWEFFEHLDEYVYVSDPETNQLVYMNQKALKSYGFQSKEEIVGLKCYEVLQGNSAPCSICNNEQLRPGYFKEWEYYNPVVKTDFRIKDTLVEDDGRMLRMEIAIDCGHSGDRETSMDYHEMGSSNESGDPCCTQTGNSESDFGGIAGASGENNGGRPYLYF